ncbi:hypothetical protein [Salirhabdus sp. Marseille-P4669]|uniref:hypothetical protein n=1 Tax=Salirhabdus sp. Marseille-P4669 TaxID=2042310 RepID=UPI00190EBBBD|nr:hypothetical protein [Salirhabdus sp. Marseille-P4669]
MKKKLTVFSLIITLFLVACGQGDVDKVVLKNQDNVDVTFPGDKPTLFFFITTYT